MDRDTLEGTRRTLERRVNGLGVSEPLIQTRGDDQVIIELPGVNDPQEAIAILQQTALLGDHRPAWAVPTAWNRGQHDARTRGGRRRRRGGRAPTRRRVATPVAATPVRRRSAPQTGPVYQTIISGADLKNAYVTTGNTGMSRVVGFELQGDASSKFFQYTSSHLGQPMSIVIDKHVISSPTINGRHLDAGNHRRRTSDRGRGPRHPAQSRLR